MAQLVYNAIKCLECGNTIVSYYTHDYKKCGCSNHALVDGGLDYGRYGAVDINKIERIGVYDNEPFEKVRQFAFRGGRGKGGTQPLTYTPLCEMNDEWLEAVLEYGGASWHLDLIRKEIQYRKMTKQNTIELLNSEGPILTAKHVSHVQHVGSGMKTSIDFEIKDQFKKTLMIMTKKEIFDFTRGKIDITDSRGRVWNYSTRPGTEKPDLKKLDEFIGVDTTGKIY